MIDSWRCHWSVFSNDEKYLNTEHKIAYLTEGINSGQTILQSLARNFETESECSDIVNVSLLLSSAIVSTAKKLISSISQEDIQKYIGVVLEGNSIFR